MSADLQTRLDLAFGTSPDERAQMKAGLIPDRLRRNLARGLGCLTIGAVVAGVGAGAAFGWNAHSMLAPADMPILLWTASFAIAGGVAARFVFRGRFKGLSLDQTVRSATTDIRLERRAADDASPARLFLVAADGRLFNVPPLVEKVDLPAGTYRIFFLSLATIGEFDDADARNLQTIAIEEA